MASGDVWQCLVKCIFVFVPLSSQFLLEFRRVRLVDLCLDLLFYFRAADPQPGQLNFFRLPKARVVDARIGGFEFLKQGLKFAFARLFDARFKRLDGNLNRVD